MTQLDFQLSTATGRSRFSYLHGISLFSPKTILEEIRIGIFGIPLSKVFLIRAQVCKHSEYGLCGQPCGEPRSKLRITGPVQTHQIARSADRRQDCSLEASRAVVFADIF